MQTQFKKIIAHVAVAVTGLTAISAQIVLMRELVAVFYGNELSLGTMLGVWLIWTAVGSGLLPRLRLSGWSAGAQLAAGQTAIAIILPFILVLIRASNTLLDLTPGELPGYIPMLLTMIAALAPVCLISGWLYTIACRLVSPYMPDISASPGRVYLLESSGSSLGGLAAGFIFIRLLTPAQTLLLIAWFNLLSAASLGIFHLWPDRGKRRLSAFVILVLTACGGLRVTAPLQSLCDGLIWRNTQVVRTTQTPFGNLVVTQMGEQYSFHQNGLWFFTAPDLQSAEESVHYALLEHPTPHRVLLLGGGAAGGVTETLRHPTVESIVYVELDPEIVRLAERTLPKFWTETLRDPNVRIAYQDGRRFIQQTQETFDVIICHLPNPYTAQLNRFYTVEFFRQARQRLNTDGLLVIDAASSENAIGPELATFLASLSSTLQEVFSDLVIIPGETIRFIAATSPGILTRDPDVLVRRLKDRGLTTQYVRADAIPFHMSLERQETVWKAIHATTDRRINRDFNPVGYYFDTILWATTYSKSFQTLYVALSRLTAGHLAGLMVLIPLLLIIFRRAVNQSRFFSIGIHYTILTVGFSEISLEFILILGFQILYGYVFQFMAVIIAGYMAGLALGSWTATFEVVTGMRKELKGYRISQTVMTLYPLASAGILFILHQIAPDTTAGWIGGIFLLLTTGAGWIGGFQFPLANRLALQKARRQEVKAGTLYSIDLIGSAVGALVTSAFLVPILGIYPTLGLLSLLNAGGLVILLMAKAP